MSLINKVKNPYVLLVLATLFWGSNFPLGSLLVQTLPPVQLSFLRWLVAFVIFAPFMYRKVKEHRAIIAHRWKFLLLLSITSIVGFNTCLYVGVQYTSPINASLINSISPLLIVFMSVICLHEKMGKTHYFGLVLSTCGVIWILSEGSITNLISFSFNRGDLFVILAVLCWSSYSVLLRIWGDSLTKDVTLVVTIGFGLVCLLPAALIEYMGYAFDYSQLTGSMWLLVIYLGLFPSIISFICWNEGIVRLGASKAAHFYHLTFVFAALFSVLLGETYTWHQLIATIIIVSGIMLPTLTKVDTGTKSQEGSH